MLRLLRLVALLMLLTLVPMGIALMSVTGLPNSWLWWGRVGLALLPNLFVLLPGLERRLGERYLPIALFLFISAFAIELTVQSSGYLARQFLLQTGRDPNNVFSSWRGETFLFLVLPIVLTAWVYGRKGTIWAATWAALLHIAGGLWLWQRDGAFPEGYWKAMPVRLSILYAVPLLVAYLAARQRQQHQALEAAHRQLQRQAALTEALAASRERNRLARELHDTLAHSLAGLVVELEAVETLCDVDPLAMRAELRRAKQLAREGLDEARKAIHDLRESPAQDMGLGAALRQAMNEFGERTGLETRVEFMASEPDALSLPPATADTLYHIVQEALTNVERHAQATVVTLRLQLTSGTLTVQVSDDGVGFEPEHLPEGRYGLLGMRERAAAIGATLEVTSAPGAGTTVTVHLTWPAAL